jgi:predicted ATPase/class 3 adenylate cyclase
MPAFLFTDIENSTSLWEKHPDVMSEALVRHNEIINNVIESCGGQVVKSTGDGFLLLFETGSPLECAIAMQTAMQEENWPEAIGELRIRIGIHSGSFERREKDIYGPDVNRAARVMDAAWGGQILITDSAKIDYKLPENTSLQNLGAHLLKNLSEPQPLFSLTHPKLQQEFPPPRSLSSQPNNLPIPPTTFIGRKEEIKAIGDLLRSNTCQMITLHGSGGIGKTRLGIEAAMSFLKHYPFGAYFISLAPLDDPADIWPAIASAVNLPIYEDKLPKDQVINYLKQKEMLLVLDNFEHLQNGASLIGELLEATPKIQVLVTSRTRLQLQKECVFEVAGLQFPTQADDEVFEDFEAVQLFTSLAQRADPTFKLSPQDYPAIVEICQLMDGMPLGIELAAYWVRVISPQEIVDELHENIDLLKTELVDVPKRHRSMRAMFDYSWKLLDDKEKQVLKSLSIFRDGCTLSAAKAVANASLPILSSLVDKSLVKRSKQKRYEMHELIRQLAEEKLRTDSEELEKILDAHSRYYLTLLAEREADLKGRDQINALNELDADFENLRLAWLSAGDSGQAELIGNALESFFWMLTYRNHHTAAQELFARARKKWANEEAHPVLYHRLRIRFPDKTKDPETLYRQAVDSARSRGTKFELAVALNLLGRFVGHILHDQTRGEAYMEEALGIFKELGDNFYIGHVLDDISFNHYNQMEDRVAFAERSLAVREKSGDLFGTAGVLGNLVVSYFGMIQFEKVRELTERGLKIAHQTNDIRNMAWMHIYLTQVRQFQNRFEEAVQSIEEANQIAQDLNDEDLTTQVNIHKSLLYIFIDEDYNRAKQLMERTISVDADPSMHSSTALFTYGMIGAGLGDIEIMKSIAAQIKSPGDLDVGYYGIIWFIPIIFALLYYTKKYEAAAEYFGYIQHHGLDSHILMKNWTLMAGYLKELPKILGESAYEQAIKRGREMSLEDLQRYIDLF